MFIDKLVKNNFGVTSAPGQVPDMCRRMLAFFRVTEPHSGRDTVRICVMDTFAARTSTTIHDISMKGKGDDSGLEQSLQLKVTAS